MVVEEILHGLPAETKEVDVNTWANTSCYMRLRKGERYVIFGSMSGPRLVAANSCSPSFRLAGNELLYAALRAADRGTGSWLTGEVRLQLGGYGRRSEAGIGLRIVARSDQATSETLSNANGEFEFRSLAPGSYELSVSGEKTFDEGERWPGGKAVVRKTGCTYQLLSVWPNGEIAGTIRDLQGQPLANVPVQAFIKDWRGEWDSAPHREGKTGFDGTYLLQGIPPGEVIVGVNGEEYEDTEPWPPTYFPGTPDRDKARPLALGRAERLSGIDLRLTDPRTRATVRIEMFYEDGTPANGASAALENEAGTQRAKSIESTPQQNWVELPVYLSESYRVRTFQVARSGRWEGRAGPILIATPATTVRVVLRKMKEE